MTRQRTSSVGPTRSIGFSTSFFKGRAIRIAGFGSSPFDVDSRRCEVETPHGASQVTGPLAKHGTLAWACQVVSQGDPDGVPARAEALTQAIGILYGTAESYMRRKGWGEEMRSHLSLQLFDFFHDMGGLRGNRRQAAKDIKIKFDQGNCDRKEVGDEVFRWGRCGLKKSDLKKIWAPSQIVLAEYEQRWVDGRVIGGDSVRWKRWIQWKLKRLRKTKNLKDKSMLREQYPLEVDQPDDGQPRRWIGAIANPEPDPNEERVWIVLDRLLKNKWIEAYMDRATEIEPRKKAVFEEFVAYLMGRTDGQIGTPTRRTRRGRDALWNRLFLDVLELCPDVPSDLAALTARVDEIRGDMAAQHAQEMSSLEDSGGADVKQRRKKIREAHKSRVLKLVREEWGHKVAENEELVIQAAATLMNSGAIDPPGLVSSAHLVMACKLMMEWGRSRNPGAGGPSRGTPGQGYEP